MENSGKSSKRKEPPFDEEVKIRELERQMRLFDDRAAAGLTVITNVIASPLYSCQSNIAYHIVPAQMIIRLT